MYPSQHLFFAAIFSLILFLLFPYFGIVKISIVFLSAIFFDVDHYLWYVYKKKDLSLKNAYNWFIGNERKLLSFSRKQRNTLAGGLCFLHGIEILAIFFVGIFLSQYFLFVFVGISFHLLLDIINETIYRDRIDKFSVIYDFFKYKKLKFIDDI